MARTSVSMVMNGLLSVSMTATVTILITIQADSLLASGATTSMALRTPASAILLSINVTYQPNRRPQEKQPYMLYDAMSTPSASSMSSSGATLTSTSTPAKNSEPQQKFLWLGKGGETGAAATGGGAPAGGGAPVRLKNVIPPSFLEVPERRILFKAGTKVELRCTASGNPPPRYVWKKDGNVLDIEHTLDFRLAPGSGNLVIADPQNRHQGIYQCFARNDFGMAISGTAFLRKAVLEPFPTVREPLIHQPLIGAPLSLKCRPPNSYPTGTVYWAEEILGLQRIRTNDRVSLDYSGNLHFSNILAKDSLSGHSYLCILQNPELRSLSHGDDQKIVPVDAPGGPQHRAPSLMWSTPTSDIAMKGENKKLKCIFSGYPTPKISWIRLGSQMTSRMTMPPEGFGQELLISDAQLEDAGYYQCSATNSGSPVIVVIQLKVESMPYWSLGRPMTDITAHDEDNVKFECNVLGSPPPLIRWFSNGIPIEDMPPNSLRHVASNCIIFSNVSQTDIQVIQCNASNKHGYLLSNAYLNVLAEPPQFIETSPSLVKVTEGKTILLKCHVFGAPTPILMWSRGDYLLRNTTSGRFLLQPSGSLEIQNITFADETTYYCHVRNKFGSANTSVHVVVRHRTEIVRPPRNQTLNVSSNVEFECSAVTDPAEFDHLLIKWYRNGILLNRNRDPRISVDNGALRIVRTLVSDSGAYTCQASNGVDTVQAIAFLTIQDRPAAPRNVQLLYCHASVAEVNWEPGKDNNAAVQYFIVYYSTSLDKPGVYHKGITVDGAARHAAINLLPWLNYTFLVTALNVLGESDRSDPTQPYCTTPQSKPFRNPMGVCSDLRSSNHLVIVWKPLARIELNGEGFYYLVTYQRIDIPGAPELKQVVRDWRSSELVIINNDSVFKQYLIYVQAVNNEGFSMSNALDVKRGYSGESKPEIRPVNLRVNYDRLSCSSAELLWDPVESKPELVHGIVRGYQIHFWKSDDFDMSTSRKEEVKLQTRNSSLLCSNTLSNGAHLRQNTSAVRGHIRQLWPKTRITAGVAVQNGKLTGRMSDTIEFETPDCVVDFETDTESVIMENSTDEFAEVGVTSDYTSNDEIDFPPTESYNEEYSNSKFLDEFTDEPPPPDGSTRKVTRYYGRHRTTQAYSKSSVRRWNSRKPTRHEIQRPAKWFIGMMSAITFLLMILIIVCILKRRRGQQYPVEEKERYQGREPERAVSDISIVEYVRRFAMGRRRRLSRRILHRNKSLESESGSLRDYEDYADMARFLEDGSFIGQYCGIQKEVEPIFSSPTAFSTFV